MPLLSRSAAPRRAIRALLLAAAVPLLAATAAHAAPVDLGTAEPFAVLGGSTVTNTGPSILDGDLGVSPGTALPGFGAATVNGTTHADDGVARNAKDALTAAYVDAAGRPSSASVSADLAGSRLVPGVYTSASSLGLSGDLTLDGQGDPGAVFVFQAGSTLTAASGSRVLLVNGAQACNVVWQVGSSATVQSGSAFAGNVLALTSITLATGAALDGRALARNGAVTMDANAITRARCATPAGTTGGPTSPGSTTPGPTTAPGTTSTPGTTTETTSDAAATTATTRPARSAGPTRIRVAGRITDASAGTTYAFQYGTTRRYGRRTTRTRVPSRGGRVTVSALVPRLKPGRRYHYRLVVYTTAGRVTGRDRTVRTGRLVTPARPRQTDSGFTG